MFEGVCLPFSCCSCSPPLFEFVHLEELSPDVRLSSVRSQQISRPVLGPCPFLPSLLFCHFLLPFFFTFIAAI